MKTSWPPTCGPAVLHVLHSLEPGGTERVACRLVEALRASSARHVLCGLRAPRPGSPVLGEGLPQHCLNLAPCDRLGFLKLTRFLRAERPALVHARNWGTWTDAALACRLNPGTKLILGFHGLQSAGPFSAAQRRRARWLGLHRAAFTTVSTRAADQLEAELGVKRAQIAIIPNGVDLDRFRPVSPQERSAMRAHLGIPQDALVVGCVANFFEPVKGQDVLLEAFRTLAADHSALHLVFVGHGPRQAALATLAGQHGLAGRVHFTGRREDVAAVMGAFDLFACPSLAEGMSNAVLEALAAGLAGVVTDVSDHRAIFRPIDPDLVVAPADAVALARAMAGLLADEARRERCGQAARAAAKSWGFEATLAGYARLYAEWLHAGAAAPIPRQDVRLTERVAELAG